MKDVVIIGCGGHGREMLHLLRRIEKAGSNLRARGFVDDNESLHGREVDGLPILGGFTWAEKNREEVTFVCAIGEPRVRQRIVERYNNLQIEWAVIIDPDVPLSQDAVIGAGCMICAGVRMTTNIRLGRHVIVNMGSTLSHDLIAGDFTTLACGVHVSGSVTLGEGVKLGTGVNIIQGITIGDWSVIGAGAAVIDDIPPRVTAVGVPAKTIKKVKE